MFNNEMEMYGFFKKTTIWELNTLKQSFFSFSTFNTHSEKNITIHEFQQEWLKIEKSNSYTLFHTHLLRSIVFSCLSTLW